MILVLDTCTVIWSIAQPGGLSEAARDALLAEDSQIYVSPISCAEIACAVARGRLTLDRHWKIWFRYYVSANDWLLADMNLAIVEEAYSLQEPFHRDPADRLIVATARRLSGLVVTADRKILDYPHVESVW